MTALSADRNTMSRAAGVRAYLVKASTTIYKGSLVSIDANGYLVPASNTSGEIVVGVADEQVVQTASSAYLCRVVSGRHFKFAATGTINQGTVGANVYVSDDQTVDDATSNSILVGICTEYVSASEVWVFVPGFVATAAASNGAGAITGSMLATGIMGVKLADGQDGGSDPTYTITGCSTGDELVFVGHLTTKAAIATLADVTSDFSISGTNEISSTTDYSNDQLLVIWLNH